MEPAPPPRAPASGPGASPRRFRSARPSHGTRAGRWGAPRLGPAAPHVPGPQPLRTTREHGRTETPRGRRPRHRRTPATRGSRARGRRSAGRRAARSRRAPRPSAPGRQRQKLRSAPRPSRPPPPLPCGSGAASPPPPPPLPAPLRLPGRASPAGPGRRLSRTSPSGGGRCSPRLSGSGAGLLPDPSVRLEAQTPSDRLEPPHRMNDTWMGEDKGTGGRSDSLQNEEPEEDFFFFLN